MVRLYCVLHSSVCQTKNLMTGDILGLLEKIAENLWLFSAEMHLK